MDHIPSRERDSIIDIESGVGPAPESCVGPVPSDDNKVASTVSFAVSEIPIDIPNNLKTIDEFSTNNKKEKRKSVSAKKPPKPPRPPRGLSLDAADQKLIKEISELAMIKRARIERMKASKKMKAAKALAAGSTLSIGNLIAILFTVIFCIVVIFQGCHSSGISPTNKSASPVPGSLESNGVAQGNIFAVHASGVPLTSVELPNLKELVPSSDSKDEANKASSF